MMTRTLLLMNPKARSGTERHKELVDRLRTEGHELLDRSGETPDRFGTLIEENQARVDRVVIGGGDGSMHAALPALIKTGIPLGILPLGTANNFARNLGIPTAPEEAAGVIIAGSTRMIDIATVNGVPFANVAGIGLSTEINRRVPAQSKKKWGAIAYGISGYKIFRSFKPFWAEIRCDGKSFCIRSLQLTLCNGRFYGAGLTVSEDATLVDGMLDVHSMEVKGLAGMLKILPSLKTGQAQGPEIFQFRGREIEIRTRRKMSVDTDGEVTTHTPAIFRVLKKAVTVIASPLPTTNS